MRQFSVLNCRIFYIILDNFLKSGKLGLDLWSYQMHGQDISLRYMCRIGGVTVVLFRSFYKK